MKEDEVIGMMGCYGWQAPSGVALPKMHTSNRQLQAPVIGHSFGTWKPNKLSGPQLLRIGFRRQPFEMDHWSRKSTGLSPHAAVVNGQAGGQAGITCNSNGSPLMSGDSHNLGTSQGFTAPTPRLPPRSRLPQLRTLRSRQHPPAGRCLPTFPPQPTDTSLPMFSIRVDSSRAVALR